MASEARCTHPLGEQTHRIDCQLVRRDVRVAAEALDMVQKGHAKIGMELSSNEKFSRDLRAAAGLLALALVAMGLIIGACIVGSSSTALRIGGVSAFGACGLAVGVVLAIYIIVKIRPYLK